MPETVLVTGGTGFIARWCIVALLERGYAVRTTVRDAARGADITAAMERIGRPGDRLTWVAADLTRDDGWAEAAAGCSYVLHIASPLGLAGSGDLVAPARDGALRVLGAAVDAGVSRVVLTSAANTASPTSYREDSVTDETLWTDPDAPGVIPYRRSKTLAERAAWDFIESTASSTTLTTILPGAVFGPILDPANLGSVQVISRLLGGTLPGTPRIGLEIVDVRDIADIHLRAMTAPAAAGQRFLATGEFMWLGEVADVLRAGLGSAAAKVPRRSIPNPVVRALGLVDPGLRAIIPGLGRRNRHSTAKAAELLGWRPRPAAETVLDCARSLLDQGLL